MLFSQQVNIAFEFQKTCFWSCLLEITFRKKNLAYRYSHWFSPFQNALFQGCVASMQMSYRPLHLDTPFYYHVTESYREYTLSVTMVTERVYRSM